MARVRWEDSCHCLLEINIPVYIEEYCDAISCMFLHLSLQFKFQILQMHLKFMYVWMYVCMYACHTFTCILHHLQVHYELATLPALN